MGRAEPGRLLAARYRLLAVLRRDEMGPLWLARDQQRHMDVAGRPIPWPPPAGAGEAAAWRERAVREARALAQLGHPNIAGVLDIVDDDGQPWLVLEAAPYRFPYSSLGDVVRGDGPLRPGQAAYIGWQVAAAIRAAHDAGVLHRDIRPDSVLLGAGNRVMLAGFCMVTADGSPPLSAPEAWAGSVWYLAPERARGEPATRAADLWSLGATMYAAAEGRVPFRGDGAEAVLTAIISGSPDPPQRCGPLWPVVSGLLRKDPGARPDAAGVDWLLRRVIASRQARPDTPGGAVRPPAVAAGHGTGARAASAPPAAQPSAVTAQPSAVTAQQSAVTARLPVVTAEPPRSRAPGAGNAGSAADFIPGFGSPDRAPDTAARPPRPWQASHRPWQASPRLRQFSRELRHFAHRLWQFAHRLWQHPGGLWPHRGRPWQDRRTLRQRPGPRRRWRWRWWIGTAAGASVAVVTVALVMVLRPASSGTAGPSLAVVPGHGAWSPGRATAAPGHKNAAPAPPNASRARRVVPPGAAVPEPARPVPRAPRGSRSRLPAGFYRYRDPTGFSIGVPDNWRVSHQGHLVYVQDPHGGRFLIIDQTSHPRPSPLADWRRQEAARMSSYPGYHRILLRAVHYPPAERAADWEFTYDDNGQLTRVLNRNILASAHHAYALYWSAPARAWHASYHYFRAFAATFRPAPAGRRS